MHYPPETRAAALIIAAAFAVALLAAIAACGPALMVVEALQ